MCTQDNDCPADISEHGESLFSAPLGSEQQSADEICELIIIILQVLLYDDNPEFGISLTTEKLFPPPLVVC